LVFVPDSVTTRRESFLLPTREGVDDYKIILHQHGKELMGFAASKAGSRASFRIARRVLGAGFASWLKHMG